jgi:hypothetical protein
MVVGMHTPSVAMPDECSNHQTFNSAITAERNAREFGRNNFAPQF